jgi:hypothetical protein
MCEDAVAAALHFNGRRRRNAIVYVMKQHFGINFSPMKVPESD